MHNNIILCTSVDENHRRSFCDSIGFLFDMIIIYYLDSRRNIWLNRLYKIIYTWRCVDDLTTWHLSLKYYEEMHYVLKTWCGDSEHGDLRHIFRIFPRACQTNYLMSWLPSAKFPRKIEKIKINKKKGIKKIGIALLYSRYRMYQWGVIA